MSVVTGIMLICSVAEENEPPIAEVQAWLAERLNGQQLNDVSDHTGGSKHPQFLALGAGINYFLDDNEFAAFVLSREWRSPENVVLTMQPEDGETRVFRPGGYGVLNEAPAREEAEAE